MRLFLTLLLTGFVSISCQRSHADDKPPNFVFLLADDLGWTGLGCFGSDFYETPHLDAFAESGVRFTNAYSACTVCSPTRASIMTGMYPARLHLTDFIAGQNRPYARMRIPDWKKQLSSDHTTIAEMLKNSGYRTGHIGKWHLNAKSKGVSGTMPTDQGFDVSISAPSGRRGYFLPKGVRSDAGTNYLTDYLTDHACQFIKESKAHPFFLYFAYNVPHTPIEGRNDLVDYFKQKADPKKLHHNPIYAAMVASLDESVGRILAEIEKSGVVENTVVVFTSDNGGLTQRYGKHDDFTENLPLRRGKGSAYEGGVRVPAIVRWPGVTKVNTVCHEPIMTTDYFPTFLKIAGIDNYSASEIDGHSITALLRNADASINRNLYWHYPHYHAGGDGPYSAVRSGDYRLIEFHEDNSVQLYNLADDLREETDLSTKMPKKVNALRDDLHRWRESVNAQMPSVNPNFDAERATKVMKVQRVR